MALVRDGGEKYLDTVFNDAWMAANSLYCDDVVRELDILLQPREPVTKKQANPLRQIKHLRA